MERILRFKGIAVLVAMLALSACGYKHRPILNVDDPMPSWDQSLPLERIQDQMIAACITMGWKAHPVAPGHIVATQDREKFSATVDILFDHQHWQIQYQSSIGLQSEDGTIHSHYNVWVRNLEHEIQLRLNSTLPPAGQ